MKNYVMKKYNKTKYLKLIAAIIIDSIGLFSYVVPVAGDGLDWAWAPISGLLIYMLFPKRKKMAILGFAEELLPFTDFVPTAFIAWLLDYIKDSEKTQSAFMKKQLVRIN